MSGALGASSGQVRGGCGLDGRCGHGVLGVRARRAGERLEGTGLIGGARGSMGEGACVGGRQHRHVGPSAQRERGWGTRAREGGLNGSKG